jgi:hypothetical protein
MPAVYVLMVTITVVTCMDVWFLTPHHELARKLYGFDPLPEAEAVAKFIQDNSPPSARVAVLGSEPEIYFLSHRHSATGYIYIFALSEAQPFAVEMTQQMIAEIVSCRPEFVVLCDTARWQTPATNSTPSLFDWWGNYQTNYIRVGLADLIFLNETTTETTYAFGTNAVAHYGKIHRCALEIFQRKPIPLPKPTKMVEKEPTSNDQCHPACFGTGRDHAAFRLSRLDCGRNFDA